MNTSPESQEEDDELDENLDDELLESPAEAREWILSELEDEQTNGRVKKTISKKSIDGMVEIQCREGYGDILSLANDHFPQIITRLGKKEIEEKADTYDQIWKQGKYAPEVTLSGIKLLKPKERKATAKQLAFLRKLGIRDEKLLESLGIAQASESISSILEARNRELFCETSSPIKQNKMSSVGKLLSVVVLVALVLIFLNYLNGLQ